MKKDLPIEILGDGQDITEYTLEGVLMTHFKLPYDGKGLELELLVPSVPLEIFDLSSLVVCSLNVGNSMCESTELCELGISKDARVIN